MKSPTVLFLAILPVFMLSAGGERGPFSMREVFTPRTSQQEGRGIFRESRDSVKRDDDQSRSLPREQELEAPDSPGQQAGQAAPESSANGGRNVQTNVPPTDDDPLGSFPNLRDPHNNPGQPGVVPGTSSATLGGSGLPSFGSSGKPIRTEDPR